MCAYHDIVATKFSKWYFFVGIQSVILGLVWQSFAVVGDWWWWWLLNDCVRKIFNILLMVSGGGGVEMVDTFHVLLYSNDSILNGFDRMLIFGAASLSPLLSRPSLLSRRVIEQSSGSLSLSSSSLSSPTTSIWISSSSKSDSLLIRCCAKYSAFNVSMSTVIPLARNLRAWRSNALDNFFLRRALSESEVKNRKKEIGNKAILDYWCLFFGERGVLGTRNNNLNWTEVKWSESNAKNCPNWMARRAKFTNKNSNRRQKKPRQFKWTMYLPFFCFQFVRRNGLTRAWLRMCIMGWPTRTFLCVLFLSPFGTTILKPYLKRNR